MIFLLQPWGLFVDSVTSENISLNWNILMNCKVIWREAQKQKYDAIYERPYTKMKLQPRKETIFLFLHFSIIIKLRTWCEPDPIHLVLDLKPFKA